MNSATQDDMPRLLLSIQASRSLLKRRLYWETSTVSEMEKKWYNKMKKAQWYIKTDINIQLSFPQPKLSSHYRSQTHCVNHLSYSPSKKQKPFDKSETVTSFLMENAIRSLAKVSEVAPVSLHLIPTWGWICSLEKFHGSVCTAQTSGFHDSNTFSPNVHSETLNQTHTHQNPSMVSH